MLTSRALAPLCLLTLICLPLLACGGDNGGSGPAPPPAPVYSISVINAAFRSDSNGTQSPAVDTIAAGTRVSWHWSNTGTVVHNVQPDGNPTFAGSADLDTDGSTFKRTFTTPGTYQYQCTHHKAGFGMVGTLVVQ